MWDAGKFAQNANKFVENVGKFPKNASNFLDKKKLNKMNNYHVRPII